MIRRILRAAAVAVLLPLAGGGCVARTALDAVTLPVKAAGKAVDWTTTSQSEADRNYGRKIRKSEERDGAKRRRNCQKQNDCPPYDGSRTGDER